METSTSLNNPCSLCDNHRSLLDFITSHFSLLKRDEKISLLTCPLCSRQVPFSAIIDLIISKSNNHSLLFHIPKSILLSLSSFNYCYINNELIHIENKIPQKFIFVNQLHYELLSEAVIHYIQSVLKVEFEMEECYVDVILQGSGAVRAGQWSRALCINDSLNTGSVFPYLEESKKRGMAVIILNPNLNHYTDEGCTNPIKGNGNSREHILSVYDSYINKSPAQSVYIAAHSAGGIDTIFLLEKRYSLLEKVRAIGLSDAITNVSFDVRKEVRSLILSRAVNFIRSSLPVGAVIRDYDSHLIKNVSAGHTEHIMTPHTSMEAIFALFDSLS